MQLKELLSPQPLQLQVPIRQPRLQLLRSPRVWRSSRKFLKSILDSPYGLELTFISVSAKNQDSIGAAQFQIENLLRLRHKITDENDFRVSTQKDILKIVGTITGALTLLLAAIAAISMFVGGIGVIETP